MINISVYKPQFAGLRKTCLHYTQNSKSIPTFFKTGKMLIDETKTNVC